MLIRETGLADAPLGALGFAGFDGAPLYPPGYGKDDGVGAIVAGAGGLLRGAG